MEVIFSIVISGLLASIVANIASNKGRSFSKWFMYGFLIWPIALIHSIAIKKDENVFDEKSRNKSTR